MQMIFTIEFKRKKVNKFKQVFNLHKDHTFTSITPTFLFDIIKNRREHIDYLSLQKTSNFDIFLNFNPYTPKYLKRYLIKYLPIRNDREYLKKQKENK